MKVYWTLLVALMMYVPVYSAQGIGNGRNKKTAQRSWIEKHKKKASDSNTKGRTGIARSRDFSAQYRLQKGKSNSELSGVSGRLLSTTDTVLPLGVINALSGDHLKPLGMSLNPDEEKHPASLHGFHASENTNTTTTTTTATSKAAAAVGSFVASIPPKSKIERMELARKEIDKILSNGIIIEEITDEASRKSYILYEVIIDILHDYGRHENKERLAFEIDDLLKEEKEQKLTSDDWVSILRVAARLHKCADSFFVLGKYMSVDDTCIDDVIRYTVLCYEGNRSEEGIKNVQDAILYLLLRRSCELDEKSKKSIAENFCIRDYKYRKIFALAEEDRGQLLQAQRQEFDEVLSEITARKQQYKEHLDTTRKSVNTFTPLPRDLCELVMQYYDDPMVGVLISSSSK